MLGDSMYKSNYRKFTFPLFSLSNTVCKKSSTFRIFIPLQISKAAMLQKGAEYIKQLKAERNQIKEEMESLRQQIEYLNNSIR